MRFHFMDAARAMFMMFGIPFHAALAFTALPWVIHADRHSDALKVVPLTLSEFRLPGFFLIAGFFAALLLERRAPREWMANRVQRLGLPLIAGMVTIVPLQNMVLNHATGSNPLDHGDWSQGLLSHLWFLPVLLYMCALLAACWPIVRRAKVPDVAVGWLILGYTVWTLGTIYAVNHDHGVLRPFGGLIDLAAVLTYGPFFAWGVAVRRNPQAFARLLRPSLAMAIIGLFALSLNLGLPNDGSHFDVARGYALDAISSVALVQVAMAAAARFLDRESATVRKLVDASLTIYLVHHPIIIALVALTAGMALPPIPAWAAICMITLALSYGIHALLRHSPLLLYLFNGVKPKDRRARAEGVVAPAQS